MHGDKLQLYASMSLISISGLLPKIRQSQGQEQLLDIIQMRYISSYYKTTSYLHAILECNAIAKLYQENVILPYRDNSHSFNAVLQHKISRSYISLTISTFLRPVSLLLISHTTVLCHKQQATIVWMAFVQWNWAHVANHEQHVVKKG